MSRHLAISLGAGVVAVTFWFLVGSCRSTTPQSRVPEPRSPSPNGTLAPRNHEPPPQPGADSKPDETPSVSEEDGGWPSPGGDSKEFKAILKAYGIPEPLTNEGLESLMRRMVDADDRTLRRVLLAWVKADASDDFEVANDLLPGRLYPRWNLPDSFGNRLLALAKPWIGTKIDGIDEDHWYFLMLIQVLERMRYEPAARELAQPGALKMEEILRRQVFVEFGKAAIGPVVEAARSARDRRYDLLEVVSLCKDPDAVPDLQALLRSAEADERVAAAQGLMALGVAVDTGPWRTLIAEGKGGFAERSTAIELLGKSHDREDLNFLMTYVQKTVQDPKKRDAFRALDDAKQAAAALVATQDVSALTWALDFVRRKDLGHAVDSSVRQSIVEAMGKHKIATAVPVLLALLNDETEDNRVRFQAAGALSALDPVNIEMYARRGLELDDERLNRAKETHKKE